MQGVQEFKRDLVVEPEGVRPARAEADTDLDRPGIHMSLRPSWGKQVQRPGNREGDCQQPGKDLGSAASQTWTDAPGESHARSPGEALAAPPLMASSRSPVDFLRLAADVKHPRRFAQRIA